jgi:hypothetical protein
MNTGNIAVIGDSGIDHILVRCKNDYNSGHLFLKWPQRNTRREFKMLSGAGLLLQVAAPLLQGTGFELLAPPELAHGDLNIDWETWSDWDFSAPTTPGGEQCSAYLSTYHGRGMNGDPHQACSLESWELGRKGDGSPITAGDLAACKVISIFSSSSRENCGVYFANRPLIPSIGDDTTIVLRAMMHYDSATGRFEPLRMLEQLAARQCIKNTVLLLHIDDLQRGGASIERPISWEHTFDDIKKSIRCIEDYRDYKAIMVLCMDNGAVLCEQDSFTLLYYTSEIGELLAGNEKNVPGDSFGAMTAFHAAMTYAVAGGHELIKGAVAGLMAARTTNKAGFTITLTQQSDPYPLLTPVDLSFPTAQVVETIHTVLANEIPATLRGPAGTYPSQMVIPSDVAFYSPERTRIDSLLKLLLVDDAAANDGDAPLVPETNQGLRRIPEAGTVHPGERLFNLCAEIIRFGTALPRHMDRGCTAAVPYLRINNLLSYDRGEIEQICETYNVLKSYLRNRDRRSPLSVCVFGPAGAGKSFVVKQIAADLNQKRRPGQDTAQPLDFNLSQMNSSDDLYGAFHQIRDVGLKGKLPVAFFDEFDTNFGQGGEGKLGWLRYFLAPMQDGEFYENGVIHTIGRAIFVFAGSQSTTMQQFHHTGAPGADNNGAGQSSKHHSPGEALDAATEHWQKQVKLPDFVSRIKAYINVTGPNSSVEAAGAVPAGIVHYLRRATLLRSMLEVRLGVGNGGYIGINDEVIHAFLNARGYEHGSRSLEAIVQMSDFIDGRNVTASGIYKSNRLIKHLASQEDVDLFKRHLEDTVGH